MARRLRRQRLRLRWQRKSPSAVGLADCSAPPCHPPARGVKVQGDPPAAQRPWGGGVDGGGNKECSIESMAPPAAGQAIANTKPAVSARLETTAQTIRGSSLSGATSRSRCRPWAPSQSSVRRSQRGRCQPPPDASMCNVNPQLHKSTGEEHSRCLMPNRAAHSHRCSHREPPVSEHQTNRCRTVGRHRRSLATTLSRPRQVR